MTICPINKKLCFNPKCGIIQEKISDFPVKFCVLVNKDKIYIEDKNGNLIESK